MLSDAIAAASQAASRGALRALMVVPREADGHRSLKRAIEGGGDGGEHLHDSTDSRFSNALVPLLKRVVEAQQEEEAAKQEAKESGVEVPEEEE